MTLCSATAFAADSLPEHAVKAAFLFNFTKFVTWPENSTSSGRPFSVCIVGSDEVRKAFDTFQNETVKGRKLRVLETAGKEERLECDLIFIGTSKKKNLPNYLEKLKNRPVLTVSDIERFAERNGIIGFVEARSGIKFEINVDAARMANLRISSKLLSLATSVYGDEGSP